MIFAVLGYHRYFSHNAFKTSRFFQFIIALLAQSSGQTGVLQWSAQHLKHHKYSDTPKDEHSPKYQGFLYSHFLWIIDKKHSNVDYSYVKHFTKYKELMFLNKYHMLPMISLGILTYLIGGFSVFIFGYVLSSILIYHSYWSINSISHIFGYQTYNTKDDSKNNFLLSILTFGDGWHNNHHKFPQKANTAIKWYEIDLVYQCMKILNFFKIIWDVKK